MKKKIKKPKLTLIVNNVGENGRIYIGKYLTLKETKISDEDFQKLKDHFRENLEKRVHPWDFEKNLNHQLKGSDRIYYLFSNLQTLHQDIVHCFECVLDSRYGCKEIQDHHTHEFDSKNYVFDLNN